MGIFLCFNFLEHYSLFKIGLKNDWLGSRMDSLMTGKTETKMLIMFQFFFLEFAIILDLY